MIPWMREKFAERRARWISSRKRSDASGSNNNNCNNNRNDGGSGNASGTSSSNLQLLTNLSHRGNEKQNFTSKLKSDDLESIPSETKEKVNVRILSPTGRSIVLHVGLNTKILDLKHEALTKLSEDSAALPVFAPDVRQIYGKYRLIRPDSINRLNESHTLAQAGVTENETFILVLRRTITPNLRNLPALTDEDISSATRDVPVSQTQNQRVDINELVLQSDLQFDVRKVIISLAQASAYVIGAGPYASRLITMLKQKLVNKRKHQSDTLQCLVDMGFSEEKAKHALKLNNGIYSAALEWLIEHQEDINIQDESPQLSTSSSKHIQPNSTVENIEALLEIVRIYSHRDIAPPQETIRTLVDMGFDEKDVITALKRTRNNQAAACEWLCGNRNNSLMELRDGLSNDSPILKAMMESPQVQMSLSNPKIFIAYLSMLDNQNALSMWLGDSDTSSVISHILRKYHEEKHVLGINQFNSIG